MMANDCDGVLLVVHGGRSSRHVVLVAFVFEESLEVDGIESGGHGHGL